MLRSARSTVIVRSAFVACWPLMLVRVALLISTTYFSPLSGVTRLIVKRRPSAFFGSMLMPRKSSHISVDMHGLALQRGQFPWPVSKSFPRARCQRRAGEAVVQELAAPLGHAALQATTTPIHAMHTSWMKKKAKRTPTARLVSSQTTWIERLQDAREQKHRRQRMQCAAAGPAQRRGDGHRAVDGQVLHAVGVRPHGASVAGTAVGNVGGEFVEALAAGEDQAPAHRADADQQRQDGPGGKGQEDPQGRGHDHLRMRPDVGRCASELTLRRPARRPAGSAARR